MMRDTPRTFVGTVTIRTGEISAELAATLRAHDELAPGVTICDMDAEARTVMVTAQHPADRGEVAAALEALGCRVHD